jgi:hypothetical protein
MSLSPTADHPGSRSYVVKLHRDADSTPGALRGRLENLATGRRFEFEDGVGLLAALLDDLGSGGTSGGTPGLPGTVACLLLALASAGLGVSNATAPPAARSAQAQPHGGVAHRDAAHVDDAVLHDLEPEVREERLRGQADVRSELGQPALPGAREQLAHQRAADAATARGAAHEEVVDDAAGLQVGIAGDHAVEHRDDGLQPRHARGPGGGVV